MKQSKRVEIAYERSIKIVKFNNGQVSELIKLRKKLVMFSY